MKAKRFLSALLCAALVLALLPAGARADAGIQTGLPAIVLGTTYNPPTVVGFDGRQWVAIGYNGSGVASSTGTMTLLLANGYSYGESEFSYTYEDPPNGYYSSALHMAMLVAEYELDSRERALIAGRTLAGGSANDGQEGYDPDKVAGNTVPGELFWPLSVYEAGLLDYSVRSFSDSWWLRTPGSEDDQVACVFADGSRGGGGFKVNYDFAVRPAFNLNLASVIFTSDASGAGGKSSATAGGGLVSAAAPLGAIKLTVADSGQTLSVTANAAQKENNEGAESLAFGYHNATTGDDQHLSCVLADDGGNVKYYGKLKALTEDASGTVSVPLSGVANGVYTLQLFSEQVNGDNCTDFASVPVCVVVNVADGSGEVTGYGDVIPDEAAPALTAGAVSRTSGANATVNFSSDEAGTYYYQLDGTAPTAAALAAAGTNATALVADEQSIAFTALSAGAHTVYIAAKDISGNVSNLLTITIPAYTPETKAFDITFKYYYGEQTNIVHTGGTYTRTLSVDNQSATVNDSWGGDARYNGNGGSKTVNFSDTETSITVLLPVTAKTKAFDITFKYYFSEQTNIVHTGETYTRTLSVDNQSATVSDSWGGDAWYNGNGGSKTVNFSDAETSVTVLLPVTAKTNTVTLNQATGGTAAASHTSASAGATITLGISSLNANYSFVRWNVSPSVTWTSGSATSPSAAFAMPGGGVTVTPVYQYNDPGTEEPTYILRTLTDSGSGVRVSGSIRSDAQLRVTPLSLHPNDPACDAIRDAIARGDLILGFNIELSHGFIGEITLSLPVGSQYDGQTVTLLHCVNGRLEAVTVTAANGMATFTTAELSPVAAVSGPYDKSIAPPQTGGGVPPWGFMLIGLALVCAGRPAWRRFAAAGRRKTAK